MRHNRKLFIFILVQLLFLILLTLIISSLDLDMKIQQRFYQENRWYLAKVQPWKWLYHSGTYPAAILSAIALVIFFVSFQVHKIIPYRRYASLLLLTVIIGPGLFINGVFKDHWGRPRPRNVLEFGGKMEFREIWEPGTPGSGKSFPCGHSSMGFVFIAVYYYFKNRHKLTAYSFLGGSLIYGTLIGIARMIQGGHFASDVLWSAGFTYIPAQICYYLLFVKPRAAQVTAKPKMNTSKKKLALTIIAAIIALSLFIYIFLFSKPLYKEYRHHLPPSLEFKIVHLQIDATHGDITVVIDSLSNPINIYNRLQGFGHPWRTINSTLNYVMENDTLKSNYTLFVKGTFNELESDVQIAIDASHPLRISGGTKKGNIVVQKKAKISSDKINLDLHTAQGTITKSGF